MYDPFQMHVGGRRRPFPNDVTLGELLEANLRAAPISCLALLCKGWGKLMSFIPKAV